MPDTQEGNEQPSASQHVQEDSLLSLDEPVRRNMPEKSIPDSMSDRLEEPPGETGDVVADRTQEPVEDGTAAEEETASWHHPLQEATESGEVLRPGPKPSGPQSAIVSRTDNETPDSSPDSYDGTEESGEAGDVVADATQSGQDSLARTAEERSIEIEAARNRENNRHQAK